MFMITCAFMFFTLTTFAKEAILINNIFVYTIMKDWLLLTLLLGIIVAIKLKDGTDTKVRQVRKRN